jgi:hypothetical protein
LDALQSFGKGLLIWIVEVLSEEVIEKVMSKRLLENNFH